MVSKKPDADLLAFAEQLRTSAGGRGRRSPLFQWMFKRASAFDQMLSELQPSWGSVAEAFVQRGVRDGAGKHPTPERIRKTWTEVRRAKGWLEAVPTVPALAARQNPPGPGLNAPRFTPAISRPLPSEPQGVAPSNTQEELLADVLREMNQRSGRKH